MTGIATDDELITRPHKGPQEVALASSADILFFGGAAGGGKSIALLLESVRHVGNAQFGAVIFRRTYPQIFNEGGLWDTSKKIYPAAGGQERAGDAEWLFPSGSKIKFAHMEHETSKKAWDGSQIPLIMFDEVTSFSETQFWYMLSRNRTTCGIRPYVRATCNPDAESWVAELVAWWIDQDTGYPIPERAGVIRWFVRDSGRIMWFGSRREAADHLVRMGMASDKAMRVPKSFTFVPARLEDNPTLEKMDPGYRANLMALEHVERERLLGGNWKVRPSAGLKFPRDKWLLHDAAPPGMRLVRFWDRAFTEGGKGARTAGVLMGELHDHQKLHLPRFWIVHVDAGRWGDAERESNMRMRAELDRAQYPDSHVTIGIESEGGAGKHSVSVSVNNLAGFDVYTEHPTAKKHLRWSALAAQQQIKNVAIVKGADWDWAGTIRELDALAGDEQLDKNKLRDVADAASGAFKFLTGTGGIVQGELIASGDPEHLAEESKPFSEDEINDLPPDWRELVEESNAAAAERRGFGRWDD